MKNSTDTIGNRTRDLPAGSAVPQPTAPPRASRVSVCFAHILTTHCIGLYLYRGADKSLARPTSRCVLFDGENVSFDASLVYIYI
jgi:hypothetical protein